MFHFTTHVYGRTAEDKHQLRAIEGKIEALIEEIRHMRLEVAALKADMDQKFAAIKANVENIGGDVTNLGTQIADLKAKLEAAGKLDAEDLAAFDEIKSGADAIVDRTKAIADETPEPEPPVTT
jgi:predicted  nucleic acid-binding Zn-ribbon protein